MSDPSQALKRLGAALDSGDRDSVMSCFATDATVSVMSGTERMTFAGKDLRKAIDALMTAFDNIKLTPSTRQVAESRVVEDAVLSGVHTGVFAGAEPTHGRVHVNVKLSAIGGPDSKLKSLKVDADTRALFAQIADNGDILGVAGAMLASTRERHQGVRVIDAPKPPAAPAPKPAAARAPRYAATPDDADPDDAAPDDAAPDVVKRPKTKGSRGRLTAIAAAATLLLVVFLVWRPGSSDPSLAAAADHPAKPATPTSSPTPASSKPTAMPKPTAPVALPVIATEAPKSVPHVQAGQQLVLKSDVLFAYDSAALTPAARAAITRVAQQIRIAHVTGVIQVNGYTDDRGTKAYDVALSRARALAVAQVLQAGLAGQAVTLAPQAFGQANPVAPNATDAGRALNRRVTIVLPKLP